MDKESWEKGEQDLRIFHTFGPSDVTMRKYFTFFKKSEQFFEKESSEMVFFVKFGVNFTKKIFSL